MAFVPPVGVMTVLDVRFLRDSHYLYVFMLVVVIAFLAIVISPPIIPFAIFYLTEIYSSAGWMR